MGNPKERAVRAAWQVQPGKTYKDLNPAQKLGRSRVLSGLGEGYAGLGLSLGGLVNYIGAGVSAGMGNLGNAATSFAAGWALSYFGEKMEKAGRARMSTGEMIARQGMNVAKSHRMAETLSMASMHSGLVGPQSLEGAKPATRNPRRTASVKRSSAAGTAKSTGRVKAHHRRTDGKTASVSAHKRKIR